MRLLGAKGSKRRQLAGQEQDDGHTPSGRFGKHTGETAQADVEFAMKRFSRLFSRIHCEAGGARGSANADDRTAAHRHAIQLYVAQAGSSRRRSHAESIDEPDPFHLRALCCESFDVLQPEDVQKIFTAAFRELQRAAERRRSRLHEPPLDLGEIVAELLAEDLPKLVASVQSKRSGTLAGRVEAERVLAGMKRPTAAGAPTADSADGDDDGGKPKSKRSKAKEDRDRKRAEAHAARKSSNLAPAAAAPAAAPTPAGAGKSVGSTDKVQRVYSFAANSITCTIARGEAEPHVNGVVDAFDHLMRAANPDKSWNQLPCGWATMLSAGCKPRGKNPRECKACAHQKTLPAPSPDPSQFATKVKAACTAEMKALLR